MRLRFIYCSCEGKPAIADVFGYCVAAEHAEAFLKIERRDADVPCHSFRVDVLRDMRLNVRYGVFDRFHPFHV